MSKGKRHKRAPRVKTAVPTPAMPSSRADALRARIAEDELLIRDVHGGLMWDKSHCARLVTEANARLREHKRELRAGQPA